MTTYFIAPAQSPRDRYAAGFDANTFTSRREAHLAIESLTETCGGEWVVSEEPTETVTADGWHDLDIADGELAVRIDGGVPVGLSLTQGEHDRAPTVEAITAEVRRLTGFDVRYDAHGWSAAEGEGEVCVGLEVDWARVVTAIVESQESLRISAKQLLATVEAIDAIVEGDKRRLAVSNALADWVTVANSADGVTYPRHRDLWAELRETLEARFKRVAILVDDVVIGDGRTGDEARADVDETCIPEGYEGHERVAEIYDARTHEVGMGPDGYVVVRARSEVRS